MPYTPDDLGPVAWGDRCMITRHGVDPTTGGEVALTSLSRGGFLVIDPRSQTARQIAAPKPYTEWWAIAQAYAAPGHEKGAGPVYQVEYNGGSGDTVVTRWDWRGEAGVVAVTPGKAYFTCAVTDDGVLYAPEYTRNVMHVITPAADGDPAAATVRTIEGFDAFGDHIRDVAVGRDGWVYVTTTDYQRQAVVAIEPPTGALTQAGEGDAAGLKVAWASLAPDCFGRAVVPATKWGRTLWFELLAGRLVAIDQADVGRADGLVAFRDGGHLKSLDEQPHLAPSDPAGRVEATVVDAAGQASTFKIDRTGVPLRIFSIASGLGRIWAGTFIPLTLGSYEPATGEKFHYGNPTETDGEIYSMVESRNAMWLGSYYGAVFTRFDPARPWNRDGTRVGNPGHLGRLREQRMLQRPYGVTVDGDGTVYFAAKGGYGVPDSGIARIDPQTGELTPWLYPDTTFTVIAWLPGERRLVVAEQRRDEDRLRLTFVDPVTGAEVESHPVADAPGELIDLLYDGDDTLYALHNSTATLLAFSLSAREVTGRIEELGFGHHCYRTLLFGPDDRLWGLTRERVYAVDRQLTQAETVAEYQDRADGSFYRFGMCYGPDGHIYFPNGSHLMRMRLE